MSESIVSTNELALIIAVVLLIAGLICLIAALVWKLYDLRQEKLNEHLK